MGGVEREGDFGVRVWTIHWMHCYASNSMFPSYLSELHKDTSTDKDT